MDESTRLFIVTVNSFGEFHSFESTLVFADDAVEAGKMLSSVFTAALAELEVAGRRGTEGRSLGGSDAKLDVVTGVAAEVVLVVVFMAAEDVLVASTGSYFGCDGSGTRNT